MSGARRAGMVLLVAGALVLAYGGRTFTTSSSDGTSELMSFESTSEGRINALMWVGIAALIVGAVIITGSPKR